MKVKCINTSMLMGGPTRQLTAGKMYDVITTRKISDRNGSGYGTITRLPAYEILITGDDYEQRWYNLERFEDVTAEVRQQKLNELGI